jgi:DNA polymerase-3 subunit epsilon
MNLIKLKRWFYRKLYKESFDTFNWEIDLNKPVKEHCFVVFDTETTGTDLKRAKVLSIGAFRLQGLTLKFSDNLNLKLKVSMDTLESIKVHGITPEDLKDGVSPKEACERFLEFSKGLPFGGLLCRYRHCGYEKANKRCLQSVPSILTTWM